jgi:hypothetical protein
MLRGGSKGKKVVVSHPDDDRFGALRECFKLFGRHSLALGA